MIIFRIFLPVPNPNVELIVKYFFFPDTLLESITQLPSTFCHIHTIHSMGKFTMNSIRLLLIFGEKNAIVKIPFFCGFSFYSTSEPHSPTVR